MIDMNGDDKLDVVAFGGDGVYVSLFINSSFSFSKPTRWSSEFTSTTGWTAARHLRQMADVNNDGLPDVVGFGDNGVFVALNQKNSFKSLEKWNDYFGYNDVAGVWRVEYNYRFLADMNNDGFLDIVGFGNLGIVMLFLTLNINK